MEVDIKDEVLEDEVLEEDLMEEELEEEEQKQEEETLEEDLKNEIDELNNKFQRLSADFANYKRRVERDKENYKYLALEKFILCILPTMDNFERAMEHATEKDAFYEGIDMIYNELIKQFEANKIIQIDPLGEDFDPNYHQAVVMEETDEYEEGKVSCVLQKGYKLNDKVIRPASVKVAK